ncbi:2-hydroxyacyl-CoA lyase 2-like isoform X2 [Paramacrobiotus metropolitanus]|uniref:2-hydroxyacyl-CoA lyase 2-like isoform X2 n=1 Tax=Paramacrobiotus metropolitanus TaxID=2943436 RepID=UPI0024456948|nr:2-hydroxyacyl-CoA lyase 2-like isoform X2 [Paramacrobiotus metropolitanus]
MDAADHSHHHHHDEYDSCCLCSLFYGSLGLIVLYGVVRMFLNRAVLTKWGKIVYAGFLGKVDKQSKKHGGDLVASVLKSHGIPYVFCLSGGHISPILTSCEKLGIRVVDTRHEVNAVFAADAVSRLSGKIGVAAVTAGPGVTNTVTAMKNAQMAQSPLLLIGGAAATILKGRGALQDIDQVSVFQTICKATYSVSRMQDIVPTLRSAMQIAQSGTPGPVFVEFPLDILYPYNVVSDTFVKPDAAKKAKGFPAKMEQLISSTYLQGIFAEPASPQDTSPLPVTRPTVSDAHLSTVTQLISQAKKPMFLVGSQCTLAPNPVSEVRGALERLRIPSSLSGMARGLLGTKADFQIRQARKDAIREADLIVLCGAVADFRLNYGRDFRRGKKIISVNRDKQLAGLNSGLFWQPTLVTEGDPGDFLLRLEKKLTQTGYKVEEEWVKAIQDRNKAAEDKNRLRAEETTDQHLNPIKVLHVMEETLPENTILVADGGDFVATAAYVMRPRGPLMWLDPGPFGTLGVGGGFALGAKLVRPECDIWLIWGDGSAGYSLMEYDTFQRHKTPVIGVIGNDACWSQIARDQVDLLGSAVSCMLDFSDYEKTVEAFGAKGIKIGRQDAGRMADVFQEAVKTSRAGQSVLINVLIGKSDFRKGSISV